MMLADREGSSPHEHGLSASMRASLDAQHKATQEKIQQLAGEVQRNREWIALMSPKGPEVTQPRYAPPPWTPEWTPWVAQTPPWQPYTESLHGLYQDIAMRQGVSWQPGGKGERAPARGNQEYPPPPAPHPDQQFPNQSLIWGNCGGHHLKKLKAPEHCPNNIAEKNGRGAQNRANKAICEMWVDDQKNL